MYGILSNHAYASTSVSSKSDSACPAVVSFRHGRALCHERRNQDICRGVAAHPINLCGNKTLIAVSRLNEALSISLARLLSFYSVSRPRNACNKRKREQGSCFQVSDSGSEYSIIYMNWLNYPFRARFGSPEYYGFGRTFESFTRMTRRFTQVLSFKTTKSETFIYRQSIT